MGGDVSKVDDTVTVGSAVTLHVYSFFKNPAAARLNDALAAFNTGAYHVGVEVYRQEWSYGASLPGVFSCTPASHNGHAYVEAIPLGRTQMSKSEVMGLIRQLKGSWLCHHYDAMRQNCGHFCDQLCKHLGVSPVPRYLVSLAEMGSYISEPVRSLDSTVKSIRLQMTKGYQADEVFQANYYKGLVPFEDEILEVETYLPSEDFICRPFRASPFAL